MRCFCYLAGSANLLIGLTSPSDIAPLNTGLGYGLLALALVLTLAGGFTRK